MLAQLFLRRGDHKGMFGRRAVLGLTLLAAATWCFPAASEEEVRATAAPKPILAKPEMNGKAAQAPAASAGAAAVRNPGLTSGPKADLTTQASAASRQMFDELNYAFSPPPEEQGGLVNVLLTAARSELDRSHEPPSKIVIGPDGRIRVTDTTATPFRGICRLEMRFPNGNFIGTGFMVHPRVVLTAGHCVYDQGSRKWASSIRVIPGKNGSSEPYGSATVTTNALWTTTPFINGSTDRGNDIAWIILPNRTLRNRVGFEFGYAALADSVLRSMTANLSGYHGDKNGQQWRTSGPIRSVAAQSLTYTMDTTGGASGSPVWRFVNNQRHAVAVHNAGNSAGPYNIGARITTTYFNYTSNFNRQFP